MYSKVPVAPPPAEASKQVADQRQHDDDCDDCMADTDSSDTEVSADVQADEEQHDPHEILGEDPTRMPAGEEHVVG